MVQHHRHQDQSHGLVIPTLFGRPSEKLSVIADLFFQGLSIDDFLEMLADGRSECLVRGICV